MQNLTVASVMTKSPFTVALDTDFKTIVDLLADKQISAVPVIDNDGVLVGVVSEADLLRKEENLGEDEHPSIFAGSQTRRRLRQAVATRAGDLMSSPVFVVVANESLIFAARELVRRGVRRLFVLDHGTLVGVVSRRDLLGVFLRSDEDIRREIERHVFQQVLVADLASVSIMVQRGVVTLLGRLERHSDVDIAGRLVSKIPGVVDVRNRLDYVWNEMASDTHV